MIRFFAFIFFLFLFTSGFSQKNIDDDTRLIIKTNPLAILISPLPLAGEAKLIGELNIHNNSSIFLGASYLFNGLTNNILESSIFNTKHKISGYRFVGGYKYHFNQVNKGFYTGIFISYLSSAIKETNDTTNAEDKISMFNANLIAGYQIPIKEHFEIDIFSGIGYKKNSVPEEPTNEDIYTNIFLSKIKFVLSINIGYKF